ASMANLVGPINLPLEEMTEAQRAKAAHLAEEARLAEASRIANAANLAVALTQEAIRLRLFLFSLVGEAILWVNELPNESITTWAELTGSFLERFRHARKCTGRA
ncbi:hypothetical protein HAX54_026468, partial [Datura stramonium]|nr:hypothetical protein [Datura stramonium]